MDIKQDGKSLTLTKTFNGPKELVFQMFQSPHIEKWWGPEHWPVKVSEQDFRDGGSWLYCMAGPEGEESWGKMVYEKIDAPHSISYRDYFSDKDGTINESLPSGKSMITFEDVDGATRVTSYNEYQSPEEVQKLVDMGMLAGVTDTWSQLEKLLADSE